MLENGVLASAHAGLGPARGRVTAVPAVHLRLMNFKFRIWTFIAWLRGAARWGHFGSLLRQDTLR